MDSLATHAGLGGWYAPAAVLALVATVVSGAALVVLHVLSPELQPSWRMVSEYANGRHGRVLAVVFLAWGGASLALSVALLPLWDSWLGRLGLLMLVLACIGQTMAAFFDINHRLHGPAAMIGIPTLCLAAVLITIALARRPDIVAPPQVLAHLPWISFALMIGALMLLFSTLKTAGVDVSGQGSPLDTLPDGVIGYVGWANRLLFVTSYAWTAWTALAVINAQTVTP